MYLEYTYFLRPSVYNHLLKDTKNYLSNISPCLDLYIILKFALMLSKLPKIK